jgi:hypothetical protein
VRFLYKNLTLVDGLCSNRVRSLSIIFQDADVTFPKQELNDDQKRDLEDINRGCRNVLNDLCNEYSINITNLVSRLGVWVRKSQNMEET